MERDIGPDSIDQILAQRGARPQHGQLAGLGMDNQFCDQRIVVHRYPITVIKGGLDPHAQAARRMMICNQSGRRQVPLRILRVDAKFYGASGESYLLLLEVEPLALREANAFLDQVNAGHHLGDSMFDLDARVHLDEIEFAVWREEKLHRADVRIAHHFGRAHRRLTHLLAPARIQDGARRFLNHLLMAALDRAVALTQMLRVAEVVSDDLEFNVPRMFEVLLQVHGPRIEGSFALGTRQRKQTLKLLDVAHHAHPFPASPRRRLDQHRKSQPLRVYERITNLGHTLSVAPRKNRDAGTLHDAPGARLVTHKPDVASSRPHELKTGPLTGFREIAVLRKKAVSGMDRVGAVGQ